MSEREQPPPPPRPGPVSPPAPASAGTAAVLVEGLTADHRRGLFGAGLFGSARARRVLDGLDLEVERGTTLGLVGTNGSGKSTLLRVLAGVLPARRGRVLVLGGTPADAGVRRRLGFVPEDSPFPPEVRALQALVLLGTLRGLSRREARASGRALLGEVGLSAEERTPLGRFSRGMARRFALAQAELHRPELLLLDEPTAGLDAPGLGVFERLMDGARARGVTVVMSSHLATDVTRHADRLAVLAEGRVARAGPPAELLGEEGLLGLYRSLEPGRSLAGGPRPPEGRGV